MKADSIMQRSNLLLEPEAAIVRSNHYDKDREFNFVLEISNMANLGDPCDDDGASNSSYDEITKGKKSQNMTECVPVPSSEHVAEIVGRQGCKIKALRNKTNTYIKTPVRGEEPVFVVTGRKEDVAMARREVQSAAEHFTQIRASRNRHGLGTQALGVENGTITLQVRVPYRVVGLVVGPKGATIKRIQQQTHTYIVTPSREKEPVFEVTGLPENVEKAKEEIEAHIAARTGAQQTNIDDDFRNNGTEVGSPSMLDFNKTNPLLNNPLLYNPSLTLPSAFTPCNNSNNTLQPGASSYLNNPASNPDLYRFAAMREQLASLDNRSGMPGFGVTAFQPVDNAKQTPPWGNAWSTSDNTNITETTRSFGFGALSDSILQGQAFGARCGSSTSGGLSPTSSIGTFPHPRLSPTLSDKDCAGFGTTFQPASHQRVQRVASAESNSSSAPSLDFPTTSSYLPTTNNKFNSMQSLALNIESGYSSGGTSDSLAGSPVGTAAINQLLSQCMDDTVKPQRCVLCNEESVAAALVPCGHNLFCYGCADNCTKKPGSVCPCCRQPASMALLIKK